ncbi:MAG: TetR/AcrR family transcriptional regulator [Candidatus Acidiferrum sp.]
MRSVNSVKKKKRPVKPAESDERVQRSKKAVLSATHALLTEAGFGGVSVDEVAKRSGVAKTTIYRHWPSRSALLLDACANLSARPHPPNTGSFHGDLEMLSLYLAANLRKAGWATVLPSIIDAAERDSELADLQARLHGEMRTAFRMLVERAKEKGEVAADVDFTEVIAAVLGPLFYRRWFSREPLDERFVRGVVERAVRSSKGKS